MIKQTLTFDNSIVPIATDRKPADAFTKPKLVGWW